MQLRGRGFLGPYFFVRYWWWRRCFFFRCSGEGGIQLRYGAILQQVDQVLQIKGGYDAFHALRGWLGV